MIHDGGGESVQLSIRRRKLSFHELCTLNLYAAFICARILSFKVVLGRIVVKLSIDAEVNH